MTESDYTVKDFVADEREKFKQLRSPENANVPCNTCTHCCKKAFIVMHPERGDDPSQYETQMEKHPKGEMCQVLKRQPNGDCVYLGESGCTIYERRPAICRAFDCRRFFLRFTKKERFMLIEKGVADKQTFDEGKKRLHTLSQAEREASRTSATPF